MLTTNVDGCDLDGATPLRALVWKSVRSPFNAKDPVQMQKCLGVVREAWTGTSSCRSLCLTLSEYERRCWKIGVRSWRARDHVKFVYSVALHTFRSLLRCRMARKICHTLVRVGSKRNQTQSRFCRTLT